VAFLKFLSYKFIISTQNYFIDLIFNYKSLEIYNMQKYNKEFILSTSQIKDEGLPSLLEIRKDIDSL